MATVVPLTADLARERCPELLALEQEAVREHGTVYADDAWEAANFLADLPGKWTFSRLALDGSGAVQGFWVASLPGSPRAGVYTHRTVVASRSRGQGVYRSLLESVKQAALQHGLDRLSLSFSVRNEHLVRFYERQGVRLEGEELRAFARERGFRAEVLPDRIQEATGHQKFVCLCLLGATP